jgi:hypothetical protein
MDGLDHDSGRVTGNSQVIPGDPIRTIASGWPTTRDLMDSVNTVAFIITNITNIN